MGGRLRGALWLGMWLALAATPAHADPITTIISGLIGSITAGTIGSFLLRLGAGLALGALAQSMRKPPARPRTEVAVTGDLSPEEIILGRYATRGAYVHPPYVSGDYLHLVVTLCAMPGATLRRVAVQGEWVTLDTASPHPDFGWPAAAGSKYAGKLWVKYYDGTQTAADPYMLATFGADDVAPWTSDMIGEGLCYAIVTARKDATVWAGAPQPVFELDGIPLYDPRQDDTAGGVGPQRWDDPGTWAQTTNPAVMAYNILRGLTLPGGDVIGAGASAGDLPYDVWSAAMDVCDELVETTWVDPDGVQHAQTGTRYTAGLSLTTDRPALEALGALAEAMAGEIVCTPDGRWLVTAGGPGLPVGSLTDAETLRDRAASVQPQLPSSERWHGVQVTYIDPAQLWQAHALPAVTDGTVSAGRQVADVRLEAVWDELAARRIGTSWLADHARQVRHTVSLPPSHGWLDPLDVITVTSERFGYTDKSFEVVQTSADMTGAVTVTLREVEHGDWA